MNEHDTHQQGATPPRTGVYVCRCGGNISDVIDVEKVAKICGLLPGVVLSKVHTFVCSDPGQMMVAEDIRKENLERVVVASCSPFLHELTFRGAVERGGMNPYLYEHVNIREQGSWAHHNDPEGATVHAVRMISAALGKLGLARPLDKIRLFNNRKALVLGGGAAGMKAAGELADRGIPVVLVEKSPTLGGNLNCLDALYPLEIDAADLRGRLEKNLRNRPEVEILLNSEVKNVSGFLGNFDIAAGPRVGADGKDVSFKAGAIIVATGFSSYEPRAGELGFGTHPGVVTLPDFIRFLADRRKEAGNALLLNGRQIRSIAFIHCVGSNQVDGVHEPQPDGEINPYCSRTCCTAILQQALKVRERYPGVSVFDIHQDVRTYGYGHEDYYINASKAGVVFLRYNREEPPRVEVRQESRSAEPSLNVTVKDWLTFGEEIELPVDLVVLGVGMMPCAIPELIDLMKLPVGTDRFLQEVHPKLRPVEVAVDGILLAGTAQGPMTVDESLLSASAAAVKVSAMFSSEAVELDPYVAAVDENLCCGTGLCVGECEYTGAISLIEKEINGVMVKRAAVNPGLCKGCGACVAVCPNRAIDVKGNTLAQFEAMVDGIAADLPALPPKAGGAGDSVVVGSE